MWSLLSRKWQLALIIGAGILIAWAADALWALVLDDHPGMLKWISLAVTIVGGALTLLAELTWRWLWKRFPILQAKTFPDLNGAWAGTLVSTWIDPVTGAASPPILATIIVRQGLFSTAVSLKTGESTSHSTRSFLEPFYDTRRFRIWYSYNNDPQAQFQHRSSPHEGVAFVELDYDADRERLTGRYYTARKTTGDLDFRRSVGTICPPIPK